MTATTPAPLRNQTSVDAATKAINWSREETSVFVPWDDGHTPETQPKGRPGLRVYPNYHSLPPSSILAAASETNHPHLADKIYEFTVRQPRPSWGSYVTMEEIDAHDQQRKTNEPSSSGTNSGTAVLHDENSAHCSRANDEDLQQYLALQAAALFWQTASSSPIAVDTHMPRQRSRLHGIAVWGLAAKTGSEVAYHMDYAEWIRYRDGVTILPALAGTWQCTKAPIEGGALWIAKGGLEHYRRHGYKGALKPVCLDNATDEWIHFPYKYNQMIVMAGHLPHLSTRVDSIADPEQQRVIVGFNVFLRDAGPAIQQAPEHSTEFQAAVRRLQQQRRQLRLVQANPLLTRRLVEAKREKVKENFRIAQMNLDEAIESCIKRSDERCVRMDDLLQTLLESVQSCEGVWPSSIDDVRAHLLLRQKEGWLVASCDDGSNGCVLRLSGDTA